MPGPSTPPGYKEDAEQFAEDLQLTRQYSPILFDIFNRIREHAIARMVIAENLLPVWFADTEGASD